MEHKCINANAVYFWNESNVDTGYLCESYPSKFTDEDGTVYATVEQYKTRRKALLMGDENTAANVLKTENPQEHISLGRSIINFNSALWKKHEDAICFQGNLLKFKQNYWLARRLNKTGELHLVHAKLHGVDDKNTVDPPAGPGQNLLGSILVRVRTELRCIGMVGTLLRLRNAKTGEVVKMI